MQSWTLAPVSVLLSAVALTACGDSSAVNAAGAGGAPGTDAEYLTELVTRDDYTSLAGEGAEVKYLTIVDGRESPAMFAGAACLFQNTDDHPYHLQFLRTFPEYAALAPERYADMVLRRASRMMWGGGLKLYPATPHPLTGAAGVLAYTVYSETAPDELLTVDDIVQADRRLKGCSPFAERFLVFSPDGSAQTAAVRAIADELVAAGVALVDPDTLLSGLSAETYSEGEAYGYLKIVDGAAAGSAGPRDVLVIDAAPSDLGLVAGLVTRQPQSLASHLNLRLREKGIPSAAVPGVFDSSVLRALANGLVHLTARGTHVEIEPARLEDAEAFWSVHRPPIGDPAADLEVSTPAALASLGSADVAAFGTKAANLGELSRILPEQNRVDGFAIPFRAYADFMERRGFNADVAALLADPRVFTDADHKQRRLSELRGRMRAAEHLPELGAALEAAVRQAYGAAGLVTRLRFRSSTNAEDLPGLSGAGLYDSRSGCLADDLDSDTLGPSACLSPEHEAYLRAELERREIELAEHPDRSYLLPIIEDLEQDLTEEKSALLAVRRVWASLWNERAFDDRAYYGIDHTKVFMGVAVHPTFVGERLEAVVLTGLEPDAPEPLYRVVSQVGEVGVAEPLDPTASPEILTFRRSAGGSPSEVALVSPSSLAAGGARLWSDTALNELAGLLFVVQDHFAASVYPSLAPLSLDVEVDVTMDGRTVIKQARPYTP
ncbi:PEP/pyruvate-binding domain-containing protein [Sorangium sp. So ce726]|uniref:PEP/pyruvate-binding domain-containing protein n=1 Tax=Sorangium sp. So ce726 TaxID=3133319 RepID=UPI003F6395FE